MSYTYVWEFRVSTGLESEFEQTYGPAGAWVKLFKQSLGYIGTILLKDKSLVGRYVTVDRWQDEKSYQVFRSSFSHEYEKLDRECGRLTNSEQLLGLFSESDA